MDLVKIISHPRVGAMLHSQYADLRLSVLMMTERTIESPTVTIEPNMFECIEGRYQAPLIPKMLCELTERGNATGDRKSVGWVKQVGYCTYTQLL